MPRFTNFPNGITSLGIPTFGTGTIPPFTGNYFFVQQTTTAGVNAGSGTAQSPYNTIEAALAACSRLLRVALGRITAVTLAWSAR